MSALHAALILLAGVGAGGINAVVGVRHAHHVPHTRAARLPAADGQCQQQHRAGGRRGERDVGLSLRSRGPAWAPAPAGPLVAARRATGAALLLVLPASAFKAIVPVLIVVALLLVVLGPRRRRLGASHRSDESDVRGTYAVARHSAGGRGLPRWRLRLFRCGARRCRRRPFQCARGGAARSERLNGLKNLLVTGLRRRRHRVPPVRPRARRLGGRRVLVAVGSLLGGLLGAAIGRRLSRTVLRGGHRRRRVGRPRSLAVLLVTGPVMPPGVTWVDDPADQRLADYLHLTDVALRGLVEPERGLYLAESEKVIRRALGVGHRARSFLDGSALAHRPRRCRRGGDARRHTRVCR